MQSDLVMTHPHVTPVAGRQQFLPHAPHKIEAAPLQTPPTEFKEA